MQDKEIFEYLNTNQKLISKIVGQTAKISSPNAIVDYEDMESQAYILAYDLLKRYNPKMGKPSTLLYSFLGHQIIRYKRHSETALSYSYTYLQARKPYADYITKCEENNYKPTIEDICKNVKVGKKLAKLLLEDSPNQFSNATVSMDKDSFVEHDLVDDFNIEDEIDYNLKKQAIKKRLKVLSPSEKQLIKLVLKEGGGKGVTSKCLADKLNISLTNYCTKFHNSVVKIQKSL